MTYCFYTIGPMGQNQARRCLEEFTRWLYQGDHLGGVKKTQVQTWIKPRISLMQ